MGASKKQPADAASSQPVSSFFKRSVDTKPSDPVSPTPSAAKQRLAERQRELKLAEQRKNAESAPTKKLSALVDDSTITEKLNCSGTPAVIRPGLEQCFDGLLQVCAILNQFGHHLGVGSALTSTRIEKLATLFISGSGKGDHQLVTAGIKLLRLLLDSA